MKINYLMLIIVIITISCTNSKKTEDNKYINKLKNELAEGNYYVYIKQESMYSVGNKNFSTYVLNKTISIRIIKKSVIVILLSI